MFGFLMRESDSFMLTYQPDRPHCLIFEHLQSMLKWCVLAPKYDCWFLAPFCDKIQVRFHLFFSMKL